MCLEFRVTLALHPWKGIILRTHALHRTPHPSGLRLSEAAATPSMRRPAPVKWHEESCGFGSQPTWWPTRRGEYVVCRLGRPHIEAPSTFYKPTPRSSGLPPPFVSSTTRLESCARGPTAAFHLGQAASPSARVTRRHASIRTLVESASRDSVHAGLRPVGALPSIARPRGPGVARSRPDWDVFGLPR